VYLDGVLEISQTYTTAITPTGLTIGMYSDGVSSPFNGYIDELRITKGVARYTSDFTPPTAEFDDFVDPGSYSDIPQGELTVTGYAPEFKNGAQEENEKKGYLNGTCNLLSFSANKVGKLSAAYDYHAYLQGAGKLTGAYTLEGYRSSKGKLTGVYTLEGYRFRKGYLNAAYNLTAFQQRTGHLSGSYDTLAFSQHTGYVSGDYTLSVYAQTQNRLNSTYALNAYVQTINRVSAVYDSLSYHARVGKLNSAYELQSYRQIKARLSGVYTVSGYAPRIGKLNAAYTLNGVILKRGYLSSAYALQTFKQSAGFLNGAYTLSAFTAKLGHLSGYYDLLSWTAQTGYVNGAYSLLADPVFYGWALNLDTGAVSKYEGFNFNSLSAHYGGKEDGIYSLGGSTDNGTAISAFLITGKLELGATELKRVTDAYLAVKGQALTLTALTDNGSVAYTIIATASMKTVKTNLARGAKGRYWQFKLANNSGSVAEVEDLEVVVVKTPRRV
jgi:hypothetical protein